MQTIKNLSDAYNVIDEWINQIQTKTKHPDEPLTVLIVETMRFCQPTEDSGLESVGWALIACVGDHVIHWWLFQ